MNNELELQMIVDYKDNLNLSFSDIAKKMGLTYEQVRYRYKKAKELQKQLEVSDFEINLVNKFQGKILFSKDMAEFITEKLKTYLKPINGDDIRKYNAETPSGYEQYELILHLTDNHIGKLTSSYSIEVFKSRLKTVLTEVSRITSELRNNFKDVVRIKILFGGDIVDGDLLYPGHPNFIDSNVYEQIGVAVNEYSKFLASLAERFKEVCVYHVFGNHGRVSKFTHIRNNWDYMMYCMLKTNLQNVENIYFSKGDNWYEIVDTIDGENILLTHGDTIKMYQNIPMYGLIQATMRWSGSIREKFKYVMIGHFHTPMSMYWNDKVLMVNGCFTSDDDWVLRELKLQTEPQQRLLVMSERGIELDKLIKLV